MTAERIDVLAVRKASDLLAEAYQYLTKAEADLKSLRGLGGQQGYSVTVNGVAVRVAEMDRYYNSQLIRGREMIHLGALKALQANVDHWRDEISRRESALAALARVQGGA